MPEIDILIPVREPAPWLPETLAGVKALIGGPYRTVVVVNGPNRETTGMIADAGLDVVLTSSPDSYNLGESLNVGLDACRAPFVARLDQDDIPMPSRLVTQVEFLRRHPDAAMTCSGRRFIDEHGTVLGDASPPGSAAELLATMRWKNVVWHPTVLFRRDAVVQLGGFSPEAVFVEDYELWLRMLARWEIVPIVEPLILYRIHAHQITQAKVITRSASRAVLRARVGLAEAREESTTAARVRHLAWSARQIPRWLARSVQHTGGAG